MDAETAIHRRVRSSNYTEQEKQLLLSLVFEYRDIIENKKTDSVNVKEKRMVWEKVAKKFNAASPGLVPRTSDSLKKYYENKKKEIRKEMAKERCELYKTGGGPPPPPKKSEDELLLSIVNNKSIFGFENPFDGDRLPKCSGSHLNKINEISYQKKTEEVTFEEPASKKSRWEGNEDLDNKELNENTLLFELQREESDNEDPAEASITQQHIEKVNPRVNLDPRRRRPATVVKALTSSNIAEKYDQLLDKRILLCNYEMAQLKRKVTNNDEEHKLRVESLRLNIAIKKKQLETFQSME